MELGQQASEAPEPKWKYPLCQQTGVIPRARLHQRKGGNVGGEERAGLGVSLSLNLNSTSY